MLSICFENVQENKALNALYLFMSTWLQNKLMVTFMKVASQSEISLANITENG